MMKMVKTCILFHFLIMILFLTIQASTSNYKTSSSKFVKQFLGSKRGDTVEGLEEVRKYLSKYGYLDSSTDGRYQRSLNTLNDSNVFDHALKKGIEKFQLFFNINTSGILDEETLSIMVKPRCNFPDLVNGTPIKHGVKLVSSSINHSYFAFLTQKWRKHNLTWFIIPHFRSRSDANNHIASAFNTWQRVSKLKFSRIYSYDDSDVKIHFGDVVNIYPFADDLALAFTDVLPRAPQIYFNVRIRWSTDRFPGGEDVESIALHEIGHAIGLAHSSVKAAVMYPTSSQGEIKRILHEDDIAGINALYP